MIKFDEMPLVEAQRFLDQWVAGRAEAMERFQARLRDVGLDPVPMTVEGLVPVWRAVIESVSRPGAPADHVPVWWDMHRPGANLPGPLIAVADELAHHLVVAFLNDVPGARFEIAHDASTAGEHWANQNHPALHWPNGEMFPLSITALSLRRLAEGRAEKPELLYGFVRANLDRAASFR